MPGDISYKQHTYAWYEDTLADFQDKSPDAILGQLASRSTFDDVFDQKRAWKEEIVILKQSLQGLTGHLFLEFEIPRLGHRMDAVVLMGAVIFVLEFKIGAETFELGARDQVWDYGLDLKNFHEGSHHATILPILIASKSTRTPPADIHLDEDHLYRPVCMGPAGLRKFLSEISQKTAGATLDPKIWSESRYRPTPTIIEAARALYSRHSVKDIARFDAGAENLRITSSRVEELIEKTRNKKEKSICLLTGVPGAGKTLVGLNVATQRRDEHSETHAVFLSGNGPLVAVLREALIRDEVKRKSLAGEKVTKVKVSGQVKQFIQNVHHFRDGALKDPVNPPDDHVVIFDEAQRAWDLAQTASFMQRKKGLPDFNMSEPEFLISTMDRHPEWAFILCLVGGGQEINTGEAGISAWIESVMTRFPNWNLYLSSRLMDSEYHAQGALELTKNHARSILDPNLHLSVSMRSFRAEHVSHFVRAVLDGERAVARKSLSEMAGRFGLAVTRDLDAAKNWVRNKARGTERFGLLASSKAQRLRPHAIDVRYNVNPIHWFLGSSSDVRSNCYLEDAATEFQVQGLEVDWACVTWDGDFRFNGTDWNYHDFRGKKWMKLHQDSSKRYVKNAYRVLLTRARQGMVIFVPPGNAKDPTRDPSIYNDTYRYLLELGIPEV